MTEQLSANSPYNPTDAEIIDRLLSLGKSSQGIGKRLLSQFGSLTTLAQNLDAADLTPRQCDILHAALDLHFIREERTAINSPADVNAICGDLALEPVEHLDVLCLNTRNQILKRENIYKGSVNTAQIRVADLFRQAIILRATAIIIIHNHPSGDPTPSPDDAAVTRVAREAGKLLDIEVLDHIIIGQGKFTSLKERGLGFS